MLASCSLVAATAVNVACTGISPLPTFVLKCIPRLGSSSEGEIARPKSLPITDEQVRIRTEINEDKRKQFLPSSVLWGASCRRTRLNFMLKRFRQSAVATMTLVCFVSGNNICDFVIILECNGPGGGIPVVIAQSAKKHNCAIERGYHNGHYDVASDAV